MRIVTIAPRSGHELLTNLNRAGVVLEILILWIQKSSNLVNAWTPGPLVSSVASRSSLSSRIMPWLAIKGSQKLPGLLWGVRDDACDLCVRARKKNYNPLIGATMVGNLACPIRGTYSI